MKNTVSILFGMLVFISGSAAYSLELEGKFERGATYAVCFTPVENCTQKIEELIRQAKKEILVQGYSFTSEPIAQALVEAKDKGVSVKVILDKSQQTQRYSMLPYIIKQGIPVWIDNKPAIAHNKVIIVDESIVKTGSFNYSKGANARNAENVLIIQDKKLALSYKKNWNNRKDKSLTVEEYRRTKNIE
jgi:phosphatidylserine/phosphatidylglycerophosphate/cardiolipin synthase-like enzyme